MNCLCNFLNSDTIWVIIIALIILHACNNNNGCGYANGCGNMNNTCGCGC